MEDRYIDILVTEDMLEDPEEVGIPPLARAARAIHCCFVRFDCQ